MGIFDTMRRMLGLRPRGRADDSAYSATFGNGAPGGFAGGSIGRLTASLATWSGAINADLDAVLPILRARARQLGQNNEHGKRFLSLVATNVVGAAGPKLQVRALQDRPSRDGVPVLDKAANDAVEVHWMRWCKRAEITGRMDFAHLLRVVAKHVARDGEALVRFVAQPGLPYGLALQLLDPDRLDESLNAQIAGGAIRQGVEIDTTGRPVALWLRGAHPGDRYQQSAMRHERVPAGEIMHLFLPERAEQVRGYTWFHAVILRNNQLHEFCDAAVVAARIGASKVAALARSEDAAAPPDTLADGQDSQGNLHIKLEAGELFELPPGYSLQGWNPEYPHANFESFVRAAMRGIAAGLDVAEHNLSGDMSGVNYSSARIAELTEREQWMTLQSWFIRALIEPIFERWLAMALLRGDITFPSGSRLPADKLQKFLDAAQFRGRRWPWVDPGKDIAAAREAVALGVQSRTRLAAERGEDFDDLLDELRQERVQMEDAGLGPPPAAAAAPPAPEDDGAAGAKD